ncbi:hypothetical protein WME98_50110 [Sorangium sp. So ce296]|uniref:hypothetical protein n=1 Tax=Sorangium sp. So ce296 TaxID=3133296 RepID=UPI003F604FC2
MDDAAASLPRSARALARILGHRGDLARKLRREVDRTVLWKLSTGKRLPELATAVRLHKLSHGRISVFGWAEEDPEQPANDQAPQDEQATATPAA